jgi:hypothetical protein
MKIQYPTTMMVAIAAVAATFLLLPNAIQQKVMAQEWNGGNDGGGYNNDNGNGYNGYAPYAYNQGGGVPGPIGGPGTGGLVGGLLNAIGLGGISSAYGAGSGGGAYYGGAYNYGSNWGGVGACCHPIYYHPWHVNWGCCGCTCAHPYVPHPAYYPRPYYPYPANNQQQTSHQNVYTSVSDSPNAKVNVYASQGTGQWQAGSDLVP